MFWTSSFHAQYGPMKTVHTARQFYTLVGLIFKTHHGVNQSELGLAKTHHALATDVPNTVWRQ
eukprot:640239-Alexandrium_andersonii.AAC.1